MSDSNESPGEELRVLLHACKVGRTDIIQVQTVRTMSIAIFTDYMTRTACRFIDQEAEW